MSADGTVQARGGTPCAHANGESSSRGRRHDMDPTERARTVTSRLTRAGLVAACVIAAGVLPAEAATAAPTGPQRPAMGKIQLSVLSSGARTWWSPPTATEASPKVGRAAVAFGTNVDANNPDK